MAATPTVIAVDGPASSGKSTLGQKLAARLGYFYYDTGCLYRAVALTALQRGLAVKDATAMSQLAAALDIQVQPPHVDDGRQYTVLVDGLDVTWELRGPQTDTSVSIVATFPKVRQILTEHMRGIAQTGRVVMVGRDIGTVVVPDASLKFYIDAGVEERARRRHAELLVRNDQSDYETVLADMRARDNTDSGRQTAPLQLAPDAYMIDTTGMELEHVLNKMEKIIGKYSA